MQAANHLPQKRVQRHGVRARRMEAAPVSCWSLPRFKRKDRHALLREATVSGYDAWVQARRRGIASVIGVALEVGKLDPDAVQPVFEQRDGRAIFALTQKALVGIAEWVSDTARATAGPTARPPSYLGIDLLPRNEYDEEFVSLRLRDWCDYFLRLDSLPVELAQAVYRSVELLTYVNSELTTPWDLREGAYWIELRVQEIDELRKAGVLDNPAAAHKYVEEHELETLHMCEPEELAEILDECRNWTDTLPAWVATGEKKPEQEAKALMLTAWRWRKENPALYRSPWVRFIRRTAQISRKLLAYRKRHGALEPASPDEGEIPLGYAHTVLFDLPWEDAALEYVRQGAMETGEEFGVRYTLKGVAIKPLRGMLESIATVEGLMLLAQGINDGSHNRT